MRLIRVCLGCPLLVGFQENEVSRFCFCFFFFFPSPFALQMCTTDLPALKALMSASRFQSNHGSRVRRCVCWHWLLELMKKKKERRPPTIFFGPHPGLSDTQVKKQRRARQHLVLQSICMKLYMAASAHT